MSSEYYVIRKEAVPEVLQKVVEVNKLLAAGEVRTVQEAAARVGISRSSYYKFKNDIEEFHDSIAGMTLSLSLDISDETGVLSDILRVIAAGEANILTIHQSIPMNGLANVSLSIQILEKTENIQQIMTGLEALHGVQKIRITGRQGI
ncbi:chorismate mutase [Lachnospiraceae bacterium NK3A20]|nr:chorismate mutase [Lachnospiraceae bacterium NK3A20]